MKKIISAEQAVKILSEKAPEISKNGFFPGKTKQEIAEMGKKAGERIKKIFSKD